MPGGYLREDPDGLGIGPPVIGAQERHVDKHARLHDPAFELSYAEAISPHMLTPQMPGVA